MLRVSTRTYSCLHGVRGDARSHLLALDMFLRRIDYPRGYGKFDRTLFAKRFSGERQVSRHQPDAFQRRSRIGDSASAKGHERQRGGAAITARRSIGIWPGFHLQLRSSSPRHSEFMPIVWEGPGRKGWEAKGQSEV